jgi:hypothetical protein
MSIVKRLARFLGGSILLLLVLTAIGALWLWPRHGYLPASPVGFAIERVAPAPILHVGMSARLSRLAEVEGYANINGPSLIRVPDWIEGRLGNYYLYFAHHKGDHIRLAYSDRVEGPWTIYESGTLSLADSGFPTKLGRRPSLAQVVGELWKHFSIYVARDMLLLGYRATVSDQAIRKERGITLSRNAKPHIASPEVIVDEANRRLLLYYHGLAEQGAQFSRVAVSTDGIDFVVQPAVIPSNYVRAFTHGGRHYLLAMPGVLYRTPNGLDDFEPRDQILFEPEMRHAGLWVRGDTLFVFWSRVGDAPERILVSSVDLSPMDWDDWRATEPVEILRAELLWEGSQLEALPSLRGELGLAANELRDPDIFTDADGASFLVYVGAGEQGIGLARFVAMPPVDGSESSVGNEAGDLNETSDTRPSQ